MYTSSTSRSAYSILISNLLDNVPNLGDNPEICLVRFFLPPFNANYDNVCIFYIHTSTLTDNRFTSDERRVETRKIETSENIAVVE